MCLTFFYFLIEVRLVTSTSPLSRECQHVPLVSYVHVYTCETVRTLNEIKFSQILGQEIERYVLIRYVIHRLILFPAHSQIIARRCKFRVPQSFIVLFFRPTRVHKLYSAQVGKPER